MCKAGCVCKCYCSWFSWQVLLKHTSKTDMLDNVDALGIRKQLQNCICYLRSGSSMTWLALSTSRGYAGRVVGSEMDKLLFCSNHCLPDRLTTEAPSTCCSMKLGNNNRANRTVLARRSIAVCILAAGAAAALTMHVACFCVVF